MRGLWSQLTDEQKKAALGYRGPEDHGDPSFSMRDREFLFNYRFAGSDWGITIFAADATEAREKIKAVGLARYQGEVAKTIRVPGGGVIARILSAFSRL